MNTSTTNNNSNNTNNNNSTSRISTNRYLNLPKFTILHPPNPRISSSNSTTSPNDSHNITNRTISSSSSIMSTPSNNIKRNRWKQQQQQQQQQQKDQKQQNKLDKQKKGISASKTGRLVKSKLLNLHQSSKLVFDDKSLPKISHKSKTIGSKQEPGQYDYSIFTHYKNGNGDVAPATRESQIRAWESGERIAQSVIFPSSDSEVDGLEEEEEEEEEQQQQEEDVVECPIVSIPGYTVGETKIIYHAYTHPKVDEERRLIEYRHKVMRKMDKEAASSFMTTNSLLTKWKLHVSQKKEIYSRIFGQDNLMNGEYMTNNATYSSVDNPRNLQKTLAEDKLEITNLLAEEKEHNLIQYEIRHQFNMHVLNDFELKKKRRKNSNGSNSSEGHIDYDQFQLLTKKKLDKIYQDNISEYEDITQEELDGDDEEVMEQELLNFTTSYLRKRVKEVDHSYL